MNRVVAALLALTFLWATPVEAQQPGRMYTIAVLAINPRVLDTLRKDVLPELARAGFVEGRNLKLDVVVANAGTIKTSAATVIARQPDAILAVAGQAVEAVRAPATSIPVVAIGPGGAAGATLESLARPKDNVTGIIIFGPELDGKRLEFLNELAPGPASIATLLNISNPYVEHRYKMLASVAGASGIDLKHVTIADGGSYLEAFKAIRALAPRALLVGSDPQHLRDAAEIARLTEEAKIPSICHWREMAEAGCLVSYGPSLSAIYRRAGEQLSRLLKGARVQDIPIEAPAVFELVVNLRVARVLGLTLPASLIARADEVIE